MDIIRKVYMYTHNIYIYNTYYVYNICNECNFYG